jgi:ferredoxin, 2Fe-2S
MTDIASAFLPKPDTGNPVEQAYFASSRPNPLLAPNITARSMLAICPIDSRHAMIKSPDGIACRSSLTQNQNMPMIRFAKGREPLEVDSGAVLMKSLLAAGLPVASSCQGDGVCGKCRIQILEGFENLSKPNAVETVLRDRLRVPKDQRISCQTRVMGDILIDTSYW